MSRISVKREDENILLVTAARARDVSVRLEGRKAAGCKGEGRK